MTAPRPAEVDQLLADVDRLAGRIKRSYGELHDSAFERRVGGRQAGGLCVDCKGTGWVSRELGSAVRCDCGHQVVSDVGNTLTVTAQSRAKLDTAGRLLILAVANLTGAVNALAAMEGIIDAGADATIDDPSAERLRRRPEEWPGIRAALEAKVQAGNARRRNRVGRRPQEVQRDGPSAQQSNNKAGRLKLAQASEIVISANTDDFTTWVEAVSSAVDRYLESAGALRQLLEHAPTIKVEATPRQPG